jgi:hypothetical protein
MLGGACAPAGRMHKAARAAVKIASRFMALFLVAPGFLACGRSLAVKRASAPSYAGSVNTLFPSSLAAKLNAQIAAIVKKNNLSSAKPTQ